MKKLITSLLISGALMSGCTSTSKVTEDKYSGFLSDYSILKPAPKDQNTLAYVVPNINWQQYNSGMVDKVLIITPDGEEETDIKLLLVIAEKFEELIKQEFSKKFTAVDHAGEGTIRVQAAKRVARAEKRKVFELWRNSAWLIRSMGNSWSRPWI